MAGTDNSFLALKIKIRSDHLPEGNLKVLDAFGGFGITWKKVIKKTKRTDVIVSSLDKEKRPMSIKGDNRKIMAGAKLSFFDIIDLDAYGIPFDQVEIVFNQKFKGIVFFTFIQSVMGMIPVKLAQVNGITKTQYSLCPTIFGQIGWQLWLDWLANNNVKKVFHQSIGRKHYGCFELT
jgi:hypothetical protein